MSYRDPARHRSPQRAVTFLTDAGDTVTGRIAVAGRTSAVLAASTGMIATAGLPTHAAGTESASSRATSTSAGLTSYRAVSAGLLSSAPRANSGTEMSAPMTATVTFESSAFRAVPTVVRPPAPPPAVAQAKVEPSHQAVTASATAAKRSQAVAPAKRTKPAPAKSRRVTEPTAPAKSGSSVLAVAARYVGTPYRYGGTTPRGFDCSGYTGYVYRQLGISLPRTANQQMQATRRISRSQARAGDLVFFVSGNRAYHVGIYAGGGQIYDSPRSGKTVQKRAIWDAAVVFGRVAR
ncbi:MAG TPA: C40 family peptidase [Kineosporiaceae bacterium]|nr:C40 family peptidase [Kineosporiaceae bacterium]